jgi:NodT family efflux transporter outer membrane factor (OMF) lipoprotein
MKAGLLEYLGIESSQRMSPSSYQCAVSFLLLALVLAVSGCTTLEQWVHNGFKVGPNFHEPPASVAADWIDASDPRILGKGGNGDDWWEVFHDDALSSLITSAKQENLDLKTAAMHVLEARALRNITAGNLFPQSQNAITEYVHAQISKNLNPFGNPMAPTLGILNVWATGFNASWELDFWGRLRRDVESSNAKFSASVEEYHDALVTLLADVATNYVQIRTAQQRIAYARRNVEIQQGSLKLARARFKQGKATSLDVEQARSNLAQTESTIPPLVISLRQANDRLCVLQGLPPQDLVAGLKEAPVPMAPADVAVGIPADLLRRRPDVRKALYDAAAQSAQVGVAEADFLPRIGVSGFIGYTADDIRTLFAEKSFTAYVLPSVQWKILNYGRIVNNVRVQDARFQQKILQYQKTVLTAGREVEDALIGFLQSQMQANSLTESVEAAQRSVELVLAQYREGLVDFNRVFTTQSLLVAQQDQLAVARGNIALNLVAVYRALGGGWQALDNHSLAPRCSFTARVRIGSGPGLGNATSGQTFQPGAASAD